MFISYGLSFLVVAIMWVNHHHMIHAVHQVTARLLWSNLNLLFWMSLVPFVTDYLGKNYHEPMAVASTAWIWRCALRHFICCASELVRQERRSRDDRISPRPFNARMPCRWCYT